MVNPSELPAVVIFDMDGVLIDSEPIHSDAMRALLADHGEELTTELEESFLGCSERDVFRMVKAHYALPEGETELAADWIARVVDLLGRSLAPLDGVPDVLHRLRRSGVRLALASSAAPAIIAATLKGLRLTDVFEVVVSGHDVASGKPAPDIFLETAHRMGVAPGDCVVVEDSVKGVSAACAAGMRCAAIPCGATVGHDFARATVRLASLEDLPAYLGLTP
jgi:HAD superfamily hydrolase (TIGR01509 family)